VILRIDFEFDAQAVQVGSVQHAVLDRAYVPSPSSR
jgi:hypothetical protein